MMMESQEEIAEIMSKEQGKPFRAAMNEVQYGADFLIWFAEEAKRIYAEYGGEWKTLTEQEKINKGYIAVNYYTAHELAFTT